MTANRHLRIFSFGYDGWGNSTEQLVKAIDAVEKSRGFRPPIFVDVRIRRQGRAMGFVGTAFEHQLGPSRHHWMRDLGNEFILTRKGPPIQIRRPAAAGELLDLATQAIEDGRRIIFFCNCPWPKQMGKISCHRTTVATLLIGIARRRQVPLEVVEWPGTEPRQIELQLPSEVFDLVRKGRMTIPLPNPRPVAEYAGLAWGSIAKLVSKDESLYRLVGPVKWTNHQWALPVYWMYEHPDATLDSYKRLSSSSRRSNGLDARCG